MAFLKNIDLDKLKERAEAGAKVAIDGVSGVRERVSSLDVNDVVQGAKDAASAGISKAVDTAASGVSKATEAIDASRGNASEEEEPSEFRGLIALLWCLAYADGTISEEEKEKLRIISEQLDAEYQSYASDIESECIARLEEAGKEFGAQNAAKVEALRIVEPMGLESASAKLLCWNLLALANSDGVDQSELDLIRYVAEKTNVEMAVFEELRNYSDALLEIENGLGELRSSDKSYTEIEPLVKTFEKREQVIVDAAQSLIFDR